MSWWYLGAVANVVIAVAYFLISAAIVVPLVRSRQLWVNRLGTATGLIFWSCAMGHAGHAAHLLLPALGMEEHAGLALRQAFSWHVAIGDAMTATIGIWYWSLRKTYAPLMRGAALFEDMKESQRRALQINDNIVQGLTVAKMALELDQREKSEQALEEALASARGIISDLLGKAGAENRLGAGELVRNEPASLSHATP